MPGAELSRQTRALLRWLGEMDSSRVTTGLLVMAFEAGWAAHEAELRDQSHDVEKAAREFKARWGIDPRPLVDEITVAGGWEAVGGDADTRAFVQSVLDHDATPHDHVHIGADEPHAHVHAHGDPGDDGIAHSHTHRHAEGGGSQPG